MLQILIRRYQKGHFSSQYACVFILTLCLTNLWGSSSAQYVSSNVINGFGTTVSTGGNTFDSSLGELAISTIEGGGFIITQGFLQPIDLKVPCGNVSIRSFPNPVLEKMTIFSDGCDLEVAKIKTYDLFGKLVYEGKPMNNQINFSSIGVGVYLVRAYDAQNRVIGVVKIMKAAI